MGSAAHGTLKSAAFVAAGLAAGFTVANLLGGGPGAERIPPGASGVAAARVDALERRLDGQAARQQALEADVERLAAVLAGVGPAGPAADSERDASAPPVPGDAATAGPPDPPSARGADDRRFAAPLRRLDRLVAGGFAPERAEWIERRTEELRMQALTERYEAARDGSDVDPGQVRSPDAALRAELGDDEYERYLLALGRPTSIDVRGVLASSPAEQAGLLPGDRIVGYDGERVFGLDDLNRLTLAGEPGETVALAVLREGQTIEVYVPRGPIGIFGGGFRRGP